MEKRPKEQRVRAAPLSLLKAVVRSPHALGLSCLTGLGQDGEG